MVFRRFDSADGNKEIINMRAIGITAFIDKSFDTFAFEGE